MCEAMHFGGNVMRAHIDAMDHYPAWLEQPPNRAQGGVQIIDVLKHIK